MPRAKKTSAPSSANKDRGNREAEKIRNLAPAELKQRERELNDQLFRLKFQLNMGQTESLKKIRTLKKDIARVKTIARGRVLGFEQAGAGTEKK
jgi:large subunit ribosomal protein L29